jgi:Bacterial Ig-like domain
MRLAQCSAFGLIFGSGLAMSGALAGVACSGDGFNGCQASRSCAPSSSEPAAGSGNASNDGGGGEDAPSAGTGGKAGAGGKAGTGGNAGTGGVSGGGAGTSTKGGKGGNDEAAGSGGSHDTHGSAGSHDEPSEAGSDSKEPTGAGGSDDGADDDSAGMPGVVMEPPRDTKPPGIASVLPPNGATGVTSDIDIIVTFDEPMDNATTEAAYQSPDLPPGAVELSWRGNDTELVIHPTAPLVYADVTDPAADAKHYVFTLGAAATDVAGNSLGVDRTFVFTTLRHVTHSLGVPPHQGHRVTQPPTGDGTNEQYCSNDDGVLAAGDDGTNDAVLAQVVFDLSPLPAGIVEWRDATLSIGLSNVNNPYGDARLGLLHAYSTSVDPDTLSFTSAMTDLGVIATYPSQTTGRIDASTAVLGDYAARDAQGNESEFAFHFDKLTDDNDLGTYVALRCGDIELDLDYLAP